ncbi:MAG TPA: gas vesicle protein K [Nitrososphaera sp.]|nr:gas vesicle protein K [Nitrososphaera sp.]
MSATAASGFGLKKAPAGTLAKSLGQRKGIDRSEAIKVQDGVASLVINLVETVIEVLERQAFRRFNSGTLTDNEVEKLGSAFEQMRERVVEVASHFNHQPKGLELSIKPGRKDGLLDGLQMDNGAISIADLVDKLIDKEAVIAGDVRIAVAGIDLVTLHLLAAVSSSQSLGALYSGQPAKGEVQ